MVTSEFFGRRDVVPGWALRRIPGRRFTAGENGAEMATTSQGFAVFQLLAVKPPSTPTFEEIHARVEDGIQERALEHSADAEDSGTF